MYLWMVLICIFLLSFLISSRMARLEKHALLDQPIARSAHTIATPRGGGLAIVVAVTLWLAVLMFSDVISASDFLILLCALPVAIAGFIDDLRGLPVRLRLPVHLLAAITALALLGPVPEPFFSGWLRLPSVVQSVLLVLALVWLLNLYNFMDGIDTLASAQCLFVSAAAGFFLAEHQAGLAWVCAGLFSATLGFMLLNLPPAKLFMGDVGSTFLGFFIGLIALVSHYQESLSVWVWVLLMGGFIADTTYTLIARAFSGQRLTEGHSTHAFQHLARRFGKHWQVVTVYMAVNIVWLFPIAWLAVIRPEYGVLLAISGIVPLMVIAGLLGAGKATGNRTAANNNS